MGFGALGLRRDQEQKPNFFNMNWHAAGESNGESCEIIGEETQPGGKVWFVCDEPGGDDMECSPVAGYGNPKYTGAPTDQYLCKQPKPQ